MLLLSYCLMNFIPLKKLMVSCVFSSCYIFYYEGVAFKPVPYFWLYVLEWNVIVSRCCIMVSAMSPESGNSQGFLLIGWYIW